MPGTAPSSDSRILPVEEAKYTLSPLATSTSGGCVFFHEPNSADDDDDRKTYRATMRRNMVAQLHRHLGPEHVAMLQALGALEEVEKQVLLCEVEDREDEMLNLEHWVDIEIELTLGSGCCQHVLDL